MSDRGKYWGQEKQGQTVYKQANEEKIQVFNRMRQTYKERKRVMCIVVYHVTIIALGH